MSKTLGGGTRGPQRRADAAVGAVAILGGVIFGCLLFALVLVALSRR